MNVLKPGYVPKDWTRGQELSVHLPPRGERGRRMQGYVAQKLDMLGPLDAIPSDAYMITFYDDDIPEVARWLDWWQTPEPEVQQLDSPMLKALLEPPKHDALSTRLLR